jgi:hypothetical protein
MLLSKMAKMNVIQFHHFDRRPNRTSKSGKRDGLNQFNEGAAREGAGFGLVWFLGATRRCSATLFAPQVDFFFHFFSFPSQGNADIPSILRKPSPLCVECTERTAENVRLLVQARHVSWHQAADWAR